MSVELIQGHVIDVLRAMPAQSVDCVVTSPPYLWARDYKIPPQVWGGDPDHQHVWSDASWKHDRWGVHDDEKIGEKQATVPGSLGHRGAVKDQLLCGCGAWLGNLGQEPTVQLYVEHMALVFAEVHRVLGPCGTAWVNLGDVYSAGGGKQVLQTKNASHDFDGHRFGIGSMAPKNLMMAPARVAIAMQDWGWTLRSEIIWDKINCLPESVSDRPTKSHEQIYLFSKGPRYYYNADAIKERASEDTHARYARGRSDSHKWADSEDGTGQRQQTIATNRPGSRFGPGVNPKAAEAGSGIRNNDSFSAAVKDVVEWRNKRSVWPMANEPLTEKHYAAYPRQLARTCILAGCPPAGKRCDCSEVIFTPTGSGPSIDPTIDIGRAGYERERRPDEGMRPITRREQREYARQLRMSHRRSEMADAAGEAFAHYIRTDRAGARPIPEDLLRDWLSKGWLEQASGECEHPIDPAGVVLDPFAGSGTTLLVAKQLGHRSIGIELSEKYLQIAKKRLRQEVMELLPEEARA